MYKRSTLDKYWFQYAARLSSASDRIPSFSHIYDTESAAQRPTSTTLHKSSFYHHEQWYQTFDRLRDYLQQMSHVDKSELQFPDELQNWLDRQQLLCQRKQQGHTHLILSDDREYLLTTLLQKYNMSLSLGPYHEYWNSQFAQLKTFLKQHRCFPHDMEMEQLVTEDDQRLFRWCVQQRHHYKVYQMNNIDDREAGENGDYLSNACRSEQDSDQTQRQESEYTSMTPGRIRLLNSIGFTWDLNESMWMHQYERLVSYYRNNMTSNVPAKWAADPSLARWVAYQRSSYKMYQEGDPRSSMTPERIRRLEELEFCWSRPEALWLAKYNELAEFQRLSHRTLPPTRHNTSLRAWCILQQRYGLDKRNGRPTPLTDEREEKLKKLGFPWAEMRIR
ncbi:hypothetical protein MPSEU_000004300 [Mayamaea pseudoterrestris]|nr:hypothetical protein MPSEU_000004300 [Mayamaea pseudoterrestris]